MEELKLELRHENDLKFVRGHHPYSPNNPRNVGKPGYSASA